MSRAAREWTRQEPTRFEVAVRGSSLESKGSYSNVVRISGACEGPRRARNLGLHNGRRRSTPRRAPRRERAGLLVRPAVVLWAAARAPFARRTGIFTTTSSRCVLPRAMATPGSGPDGAVTYAAHYPVGYPPCSRSGTRSSGRSPWSACSSTRSSAPPRASLRGRSFVVPRRPASRWPPASRSRFIPCSCRITGRAS